MINQQNFPSRVVIAGIILSGCTIYLLPLFLPTPLLEPDEGLHATISQEMLETHEWILPTFRGEPFLDKPVLYFWAQMVSMKWLGMTELAVRLPGLLFGMLGAITTGLLAATLFSRRIGWLATLMHLTMMIPLALAQAAVHDVALVPWTNLALLSLWRMEHSESGRKQFAWMLAASIAFALAFLTKALIGVAVIGVGYAAFLFLTRQLTFGSVLRVSGALCIGALLASPWFIAMEGRVPGYLYYYFVERHVMGFATETQRHGGEPFHYYLPFITLGGLPWAAYLWPLITTERRALKETWKRGQILFVVCWLVGGLLFLSVAKSKLVTYALPLFPALAILGAVAWGAFLAHKMSSNAHKHFRWIVQIAGTGGVAIPAAVLVTCGLIAGDAWSPAAWILAVTLGAISLFAWKHFERHQSESTVGLISVYMAGLVGLLMAWPLQHFASAHSERELAEWVNAQPDIPEHLVVVGEKPFSVLFYLKPELRHRMRSQCLIAGSLQEITSRTRLPPGIVVAATDEALSESAAHVADIPATFEGRAGQFSLYRSQDDFYSLVQVAWRSDQ